MSPATTVPSPLKPQWFHILLALSRQNLHGYGIQRAVLAQTDDAMRLWPAMLYRSLASLEEARLITTVGEPAEASPDERRQYYAITKLGRRVLRDEARLMARWAAAASSVEPR